MDVKARVLTALLLGATLSVFACGEDEMGNGDDSGGMGLVRFVSPPAYNPATESIVFTPAIQYGEARTSGATIEYVVTIVGSGSEVARGSAEANMENTMLGINWVAAQVSVAAPLSMFDGMTAEVFLDPAAKLSVDGVEALRKQQVNIR